MRGRGRFPTGLPLCLRLPLAVEIPYSGIYVRDESCWCVCVWCHEGNRGEEGLGRQNHEA